MEPRRFRGISRRLAVEYLENLGGERVDEGDGDDGGGGSGDGGDASGDVARVEGDGWTASVSEETVSAAGSIELTEVTVDFDGDDDALEPLVEAFARKAIRAGG